MNCMDLALKDELLEESVHQTQTGFHGFSSFSPESKKRQPSEKSLLQPWDNREKKNYISNSYLVRKTVFPVKKAESPSKSTMNTSLPNQNISQTQQNTLPSVQNLSTNPNPPSKTRQRVHDWRQKPFRSLDRPLNIPKHLASSFNPSQPNQSLLQASSPRINFSQKLAHNSLTMKNRKSFDQKKLLMDIISRSEEKNQKDSIRFIESQTGNSILSNQQNGKSLTRSNKKIQMIERVPLACVNFRILSLDHKSKEDPLRQLSKIKFHNKLVKEINKSSGNLQKMEKAQNVAPPLSPQKSQPSPQKQPIKLHKSDREQLFSKKISLYTDSKTKPSEDQARKEQSELAFELFKQSLESDPASPGSLAFKRPVWMNNSDSAKQSLPKTCLRENPSLPGHLFGAKEKPQPKA